jgi:predicted Fe-S protein YdhL (DUF1289 family)
MDPQRDVCMGCARSLDEIARWGVMHEDERNRVMAELPARRERLGLPQVSFQDDGHGPEH